MDEYSIDFSKVRSVDDAHDVLVNSLGLPDYYGRNLDALWDCLTELGGNIRFRLRGKSALLATDPVKGPALYSVFDELSQSRNDVIVEWAD